MTAAALANERALPSATWRTARWLVGRALRIVAAVAPLMLLLVVGLVPAAMAGLGVAAPGSLWAFGAQQAPPVLTLVIAAMSISHLATHLAFGMTRRSFAAAVGVVVVTTSAVLALVVPVGFAVEAAHFGVYGWAHQAPADLGVVVLTSFLRAVVWGCAGALGAAIWYRFGAFVGVAAMPFAVVLPIVTTAMRIERVVPFGVVDAAVLVGIGALLAALYWVVVVGAAVKARTA